MFSFVEGASLKIAKNLIRATHMQDSLAIIKEKSLSAVGVKELLELILALNTCNLIQTTQEDFIRTTIEPEDLQDLVDDYVFEALELQDWIPIRDGAERMEKSQEISGVAEKLRVHWQNQEEMAGPGPRYFCVKDVLKRLGNENNMALRDALFEFVVLQI